mgnify:FL=1
MHIPKVKRGKLEDTAEKGIMVGYMPNGYRILLDDNTVQLSRDVRFKEKETTTHRSTGKEEARPKEAEDDEDDEPPSLLSDSEDEDDGGNNGDDNGGDNGDDGNDNNNQGDNNGGAGDEDGPAPPPGGAGAGAGASSGQGSASGATRTSARGSRGLPAARYGDWVQAARVETVTITEPQTYEEALASEEAENWKQACLLYTSRRG